MSDRLALPRRIGLALCLLLPGAAARAEPAVRLLDLPFKVREMRGPRSEVAVSIATSGLLPIARAKVGQDAGEEESAPIAVVWGEEGGAVLGLDGGAVSVRPIGREAVEGLTAAETPRGALPGVRRALAGPLSAYLTGRTRAPDGGPAAAGLTVRERQALPVGAEPRPVPVATVTVPPGGDAVFAPAHPRVLRLAGRPALVAATLSGAAGGLVLITRPADSAAWAVTARTPPQPGPPLKVAGIADFSGTGRPQAAAGQPQAAAGPIQAAAGPIQLATVSGRGLLQVWTLAPDRIEAAGEAPGYMAGAGDADLAATLATGGPAEIALPVAGGSALALVQVNGGVRERLRVPLPAPAATGIVALGEGPAARLLVGLADGRVAVVAPDGGRP